MEFINRLFSSNFYSLIIAIIPSITSFFVGRYTSNRPKKLAVKEKQLSLVYSPLYKTICVRKPKQLTTPILRYYDSYIRTILSEHYDLINPDLRKLSEFFYKNLKDDNTDTSILVFNKIYYQVKLNYDLLKHSLGYPTQNVFSTFRFMTPLDKAKYFCGTICVPLMLFSFSFLWLNIFIKNNFFINITSGFMFFSLFLLLTSLLILLRLIK